MRGRFYRIVRDLHLYFGLFISPFVLVFSISVLFLVHSWLPKFGSVTSAKRIVSAALLLEELQTLSGRPLIEALKPVLAKAAVRGEVGFVRRVVKEERLIIPVIIPGRETSVNLSLGTGEATIETRETGLADALMTLHKSPGQHGPDIRMNWFYMRARRWMADTTGTLTTVWAYSMDGVAIGLVFMVLSSLLMWFKLPQKRTSGAVVLGLGTLLCGWFCVGLRWFF